MRIFCPLCEKETEVNFVSNYKNQTPFFANRDLYECKECNLIFIHPMPSPSDLDKYYETVWTVPEESMMIYYLQAEERVKYIKRHISLPPDIKILDVGSGRGLLYSAFKNNGFPEVSFTAIEKCPENLEQLKKLEIQYFSDISDLASIGDQQFDLVTITFVLEHIGNPVLFISGILRYVKPGGYIYVDIPERDDTFKLFLEPHVVVYTEKSFLALADKLGLSVIHNSGYGTPRNVLIEMENRTIPVKLYKYLEYLGSEIETQIYSALYPKKAFDFRKKKLNSLYHFDEEGSGRWWIRFLMKKG